MTSKAKRRLTNIRVNEVSIVDEGANGKSFIIIKRKGEAMAGKTKAQLLKSVAQPTDVLKVSENVKKALQDSTKQAIEKANKVLSVLEKVEILKDANDEVPAELITQIEEIVKSLPSFDSEEGEEDAGISEVVTDLEEIKKAGKKISSTRLEKLSQAVTLLTKLLEDLGESATSVTKEATSPASNTEGGSTVETKEVKKRAPEESLVLAQAEVVKAREELSTAEESTDAAKITKAKDVLAKAEEVMKAAKDEKEKAEKDAEIEKAQKAKDEAEANLKKAKGEVEQPESEVLKALQESNKTLNETIAKQAKMLEEQTAKIEEIAKGVKPGNSQTTEEVQKTKDEPVAKAGKQLWGNIF